MIARIQEALHALHIDTWRLNWNHTQSAELFFIRREADMRRATDVTEAQVTVFHDFEDNGEKMRGSALVNVYPGMGDAALQKALLEAYASAAHVKNAWYALPDAVVDSKPAEEEGESLAQTAKRMADAMFSADVGTKAFINSAEIFVVRSDIRVMASNGLDVSYVKHSYKGEFVVQCEEPQDVELYRSFAYTTADTDALRREAEEALRTVRDRSSATQAPIAGAYDCVLSGDQVSELLSGYAQKADAGMVYAHYSTYAVGNSVQGDEVRRERLNIALTSDVPYSEEGVPMPGMVLTEAGILKNLHGATRFCRYLGMEPRGSYDAICVENGSVPMQELLAAPCIHPVAFSDFQMDPLSGRFGGEIRLAYVHDADGVHVVTGGSVSGSLLQAQKDMLFSTERYVSKNYDGPMAVRLKNVSVAGRKE